MALLATSLVCVVGCGIWETGTGYLFQAYLPWESFIPGTSTGETAGTKEGGATAISLLVFFSYLILLNTVVPISLYVRLVYHLWLCQWLCGFQAALEWIFFANYSIIVD